MTEFVIVWPILVMLVLGTFQLALIYLAKTTLNYATFEAARAGALNHASRKSIERGFARGMAALYTSVPAPFSIGVPGRDIQEARDVVLNEIQNNYVCIERTNPSESAFSTHGDPDTGEIPNDNLMYRDPDASSGISIQDANLLKLRVTYCYRLIVPLMNRLIPALMRGSGSQEILQTAGHSADRSQGLAGLGTFRRRCLDQQRIPIVAQSIIRMQSAAINDSFPRSCN